MRHQVHEASIGLQVIAEVYRLVDDFLEINFGAGIAVNRAGQNARRGDDRTAISFVLDFGKAAGKIPRPPAALPKSNTKDIAVRSSPRRAF